MLLFDITGGPAADHKAKQLMNRANSEFQKMHDEQKRDVADFWKHDFEETATGPTGVECLTAMGTKAQSFLGVAYAKVVMMLTCQAALGKDNLVDVAAMMPPYKFEFNLDGSLKTATRIAAPEPEAEE